MSHTWFFDLCGLFWPCGLYSLQRPKILAFSIITKQAPSHKLIKEKSTHPNTHLPSVDLVIKNEPDQMMNANLYLVHLQCKTTLVQIFLWKLSEMPANLHQKRVTLWHLWKFPMKYLSQNILHCKWTKLRYPIIIYSGSFFVTWWTLGRQVDSTSCEARL